MTLSVCCCTMALVYAGLQGLHSQAQCPSLAEIFTRSYQRREESVFASQIFQKKIDPACKLFIVIAMSLALIAAVKYHEPPPTPTQPFHGKSLRLRRLH